MAYFGPFTRFGDLMGSPEAVAVIDKYMPGATPYLTPEMPMMDLSLQRITASYPPEMGKAFIQEIEQCSSDKMHGGQILARALKQEGVEKVFTLSGDHTMAMYYGLVDEGIEVIDFRHESAAVCAAIGYARASGKPAVCIVTAGPGEANAYGGLMDAVQGSTPVLLISGGSPVSQNQTFAMQEYDFVPVFREACKWSERVYDVNRIGDYVHIAFRNMMTGAPGPALLEIPYDVLYAVCHTKAARERGVTRVKNPVVLASPDDVDQAAELLAKAQKPVMLVGTQAVFFPNNREYAQKLSEYLLMPVGAIFDSKGWAGNEAERPELKVGLLGTAFADLILLVNFTPDYQFNNLQPPVYNPFAKVISINSDPTLIGLNRDVDVGLIGTPGDVCKQLYDKVITLREQQTDYSFIQQISELAQQLGEADAVYTTSDAMPINPKRACKDIADFLNVDQSWNVISDGGDAAANIGGPPVACKEPGQFVFESRFGGIGTALPMAIGQYYGRPAKTMLVTGDGAFGFYFAELITAVFRKIPLVCVVLNNNCWGMIKGMEDGIHGGVLKQYNEKAFYGIGLNLPEVAYDKICEAIGGYGETVTDPNELIPAIKRAEASGKTAVINVICADISDPGVVSSATTGYCDTFGPLVQF